MKRFTALLASLLFLFSPSLAKADSKDFFFKSGDRIVFLGDSITEQYQYSTDIELYLTTRFPNWNLVFINAGIGGDTATGGANRFATHVLAEKPTALTINFGMNDAGYGAFNPEANARYVKNTAAMLEAAKKDGVRVALLSPNAVDRRKNERFKVYLETQKQFYAPLKPLASDHGAAFVDQYATTRAGLEKMEADNAKSVVPFGDGFHTASPGGLFMAHAILTGLNAPALVSSVEIDAGASRAKATDCSVEKLEASKTAVTFTRTDNSLPLPVQADWVSLLPYVNQLNDLNHYGIKVSGLEAGTYTLSIDGTAVGKFSDSQLAEGVNLGNLTTGPIHDQGQKVFNAINEKNKIVHGRFRNVVMFLAPDWLIETSTPVRNRELTKRMDKVSEIQAEIYKLVQPVPHQFVLKAAK